jgi:predicted unusual protein kinase regulating ubiquinone biosynthesis (AarF/ABC1/UbiB family)
MEWIDGIRCTDPDGIRSSGLDVEEFIRCGVVSGLRQLLEFGLFHGDPHPGNIFAVCGVYKYSVSDGSARLSLPAGHLCA